MNPIRGLFLVTLLASAPAIAEPFRCSSSRGLSVGPPFDVTPKDKTPGEVDSLTVGLAFACCELVGGDLRKFSLTMEHFPRARVGLATHRTASLENHRCCPSLL
jgi:hypothetical protein